MMIFLDYNSTTPIDPRVLEAMLPFFNEKFGNAASRTHAYGWVAEQAVEDARKKVAVLINAEPSEITFTSGATEAINLAIKGVYEAYRSKGNHIITVSTEHKAVLDTCAHLEKTGAEITLLKVNREGFIDLDELKNSITDKTILVSVMMANNETGVIQPLDKISKIVHERGSILMSDATQAIGKIAVDVSAIGGDLLSMSAHKLYGPKGTGALYIRRKNPRVKVVAQMDGGGHENGLRSGTLNVPGIVGLGKACEIAKDELFTEGGRISMLRTLLEQSLVELGNVYVNGSIRDRLPNTTNLSFQNIQANSLIKELRNVAVATGSACTSAIPQPSHVLKAMGISDELSYSAIRFSLGRFTTAEEINYCIDEVKKSVGRSHLS